MTIEYPYTKVTGKLQSFFQKIQSMGLPDSVTTKYLPSIGFASNNDRSILKIVKFIGFTEHSNKPTQRWRLYRDDSQAKRIMAEGIRDGYHELFNQYPDAYRRSDTDLKNFFKTRSTGGDQVVTGIVTTFKALCSLAEFSDTNSHSPQPIPSVVVDKTTNSVSSEPSNSSSNAPTLHIDIQIHIDSDATPEQIDKIFESMAKHLYKNGSN